MSLRVLAADDDFSADLYHIIKDSARAQETCHLIDSEAFGHGAAVEDGARVVAHEAVVVREADVVEPYELPQRIDGGTVGQCAVFISEAPSVHQRCHGDVEGSSSGLADLLREAEDLAEEGVGAVGSAAVQPAQGALWVEHREALVDFLQLGAQRVVEVFWRLVGEVVEGAEYGALVLLVGRGAVVAGDDEVAANDQEGEDGQVPAAPLRTRSLILRRQRLKVGIHFFYGVKRVVQCYDFTFYDLRF